MATKETTYTMSVSITIEHDENYEPDASDVLVTVEPANKSVEVIDYSDDDLVKDN